MKCDLNGIVNKKLQGRETTRFTEVLYVPQAVKNILSILRILSKVAIIGATKYKITIKENGVNMILDARK